ncbi:MAG: tetratricopeptide repeat protein, partial [Pirellulales bacterium]
MRIKSSSGPWVAVMACCLLAVAAQAEEAVNGAPDSPPATDVAPQEEEETEKPPLVLEDLIAPLEQLNPATDEQRSQVEALSLFAAGRMKEQQEDYGSALRLYQRALRHDPDSLTILRDIVRVAFHLERNAEAVRYALKAAELAPSDPLWLRQLGVVMKEEGDLAGATELYEQALKLEQDKKSASFLMLTMELGKLYFLAGQPAKAAESFTQVMPALDNPGDYGLDEKTLQKTLLEEAAPTYLLIGKAFLAAEQPDAALAAFEKAQAAAPDAALHAYHLAQVEALRGEPAKALEQLDEYLEAQTAIQGAAPYELLARLLTELNKSDELIGRLEELRKLDGRN